MITLHNLKDGPPRIFPEYAVRIDRTSGSPLGNPFPITESMNRARVCIKYRTWFYEQLGFNPAVCRKLAWMIETYKKHGKLELWCHCAPLKCKIEYPDVR
jgi:hypothetical protein